MELGTINILTSDFESASKRTSEDIEFWFARDLQHLLGYAKWDIPSTKPLADFMPTILLKAKDFATEITIYNAKENQMSYEQQISNEHITNNKAVRETLISRGITPENVKPSEDIKKVERKLNSETKKALKTKDKLQGDKE